MECRECPNARGAISHLLRLVPALCHECLMTAAAFAPESSAGCSLFGRPEHWMGTSYLACIVVKKAAQPSRAGGLAQQVDIVRSVFRYDGICTVLPG